MDTSRTPNRLPPGAQTLVKYLVSAGVGARRECADLIMGGHVRVNGIPTTNLTHAVRGRDRVDVDGTPVRPQEDAKPIYLILNKPKGFLSTVRDDRGRKTVLDLVPTEHQVPGLVPAGRLDLDSTGLMLLTNDGNLVDIVTHPSYGVEKEYKVVIDRPLSQDRVFAMVNGIPLEDGMAKAKQVRKLSEEAGAYTYTVTLVEGKKREIRRMLMAVGRRVLELERTRMGNLTLGQLPQGQLRPVTTAELRGLLAIVEKPLRGPRLNTGARDDEEPERGRPRGRRPWPPERGGRDQDRERPQTRRPAAHERGGGGQQPPARRPSRPYTERNRDDSRPPERGTGPRQYGETSAERERPQGPRPSRQYDDRDRERSGPRERPPGPHQRSHGNRNQDRPQRPRPGSGERDNQGRTPGRPARRYSPRPGGRQSP